jgi:transcriptional regulator with XRE-family HTH domain
VRIFFPRKIANEEKMSEHNTARLFGKTIATRWVKRKLTQEEFASRIGMSIDAVSRMENGRMAPKMSRFQDIADVLECSVADLFRAADFKASGRAATITDILQALPDDAQDALVELMAQAVITIKSQKMP